MKNPLLTLALIFTLSLTIIIASSCSKETDSEKAKNDLIGTWTIDNTTSDLTVGGVDLVTYMTTNFDYTQQEAETLVNAFIAAIDVSNEGTINFRDDDTYRITTPDETEDGTWSVNDDGNKLILVYDDGTDNLTIVNLSSSDLTVSFPTETEDVDLDDDGDDETTINIDMTVDLSK